MHSASCNRRVRPLVAIVTFCLVAGFSARAQGTNQPLPPNQVANQPFVPGPSSSAGQAGSESSDSTSAQARFDRLEALLAAQDARIRELERRLADASGLALPSDAASGAAPISKTAEPGATLAAAVAAVAAPPIAEPVTAQPGPMDHEHSMTLPGGPKLKISGFADLNLGFGSDANPLIFPLVPAGTSAHNTFQIGEFDLFLSSKLAEHINFVGELVIGADQTNYWGLDIERLQVTYKPSRFFSISGGRYHTSIGYYNTAFHHGTWFQTATGRPFMYFFEDSGGILPVHEVGVTTFGQIPKTGALDLHWVAEVGNGRSSDSVGQPVQNFLSDKNHKAFNLAVYSKPLALPGLQFGGSYYRDRMVPPGLPDVTQNISSLYAVYINSSWESLNEFVWMNDRSDGATKSQNSPLSYSQISRKFGNYRPYFRYQYLNVNAHDPVSIYTGRYEGPSLGIRGDFTNFVTLKAQYNRLYQRGVPAANGLDLQMAFAF